MPKRRVYPKADELAKKYSIEYVEELLRLCPSGVDRLYDLSQGAAVRVLRVVKKKKPAPLKARA